MEGFIYAAMIIGLYFLPTLVAVKERRGSVFILNLFFGWTLLGWVIALWSAIRSRENVKKAM